MRHSAQSLSKSLMILFTTLNALVKGNLFTSWLWSPIRKEKRIEIVQKYVCFKNRIAICTGLSIFIVLKSVLFNPRLDWDLHLGLLNLKCGVCSLKVKQLQNNKYKVTYWEWYEISLVRWNIILLRNFISSIKLWYSIWENLFVFNVLMLKLNLMFPGSTNSDQLRQSRISECPPKQAYLDRNDWKLRLREINEILAYL